MVELLLPESDANASNKNGQTALMYAARYGNKDLVGLLLPKSDAKATDKQGYTALMYAAFYGTEQMVKILLSKSDAKANNNYDGKTALMYAVRRYGKTKMVELLLPESDVKAVCCQTADDTDSYGYTAIDLAKSFGNSQIVSLLRQYN